MCVCVCVCVCSKNGVWVGVLGEGGGWSWGVMQGAQDFCCNSLNILGRCSHIPLIPITIFIVNNTTASSNSGSDQYLACFQLHDLFQCYWDLFGGFDFPTHS